MTEVNQEKPKCSACGNTEDDHPFKHPFTLPGEQITIPEPPSKKKKEEPQARVMVAPMPDLVLRGLLLRLGIITSGQLEAVERELTLGFTAPPGPTDVLSTEPPANT